MSHVYPYYCLMPSSDKDDRSETAPRYRSSTLSPKNLTCVLLSVATLAFVIFGYPGGFQFESETFDHNMEPGSRLEQFPQKDQPDQFSLRFTRSELKGNGQLIFRSTSNFDSTYFLEIGSSDSDELTFFSPGLGARNDFIERVELDAGCNNINILVERQDNFSSNKISVFCEDLIADSFDSPSFIFTTAEAGIRLQYKLWISHFVGDFKTAAIFHAATLLWWAGLVSRAYPSGSKKRTKGSRSRLSNFSAPFIAFGVLGLAVLTMPALVDDGSVLSIIKNFRTSSGATNNIFSASASEWPVGSGAIALLNLVIGSNPSVLITRIPIYASFVISVYFLYLTSLRARPEIDQQNRSPVLLLASYSSILVGWGVTLRLEFLLLPIASALLYLLVDGFNRATLLSVAPNSTEVTLDVDIHELENTVIKRSFGLLFLGGVAVSITQAGLAIFLSGFVGAYQILRLAKRMNARIFSYLLIFGVLGFVSTQPWISIHQFLRITGTFRAANGSLHSTNILSEIDRYIATTNESTLRIFGVYLLLIGLVSCVLLISSQKCKRSSFLGTVTFSAYIGLSLTSSRWMWHLIVLAPFASLSLHTLWERIREEPATQLENAGFTRKEPIQERFHQYRSSIAKRLPILIFIFALIFLSLSSLSRSTRPLTGSTPNLRDPETLAAMQSRIDTLLAPAFGPIPLVFAVLILLICLLLGTPRRASTVRENLAISLVFIPIFALSFFPLFSASFNEDTPSHVGLPLYELRHGEDCGWLSNYGDFLLPAHDQLQDEESALKSQLEQARSAFRDLQWVSTTDFYTEIPSGFSVIIRNHKQSVGHVEIETLGSFNFPAQAFSEVRVLTTVSEPQTFFVKLANADLALLDTRQWAPVNPSTVVRFSNTLADPVFHTLTPCVSSESNNGIFWSQFDWTLSNPSITDLGQSAPLDVGLRLAGEYGVVRVSCPIFDDLVDENQCLYLYL